MNRIALGLMLSLFSLTTANSEDAEAQKSEEHIYQAGVDFTAALASHLLVEIGDNLMQNLEAAQNEGRGRDARLFGHQLEVYETAFPAIATLDEASTTARLRADWLAADGLTAAWDLGPTTGVAVRGSAMVAAFLENGLLDQLAAFDPNGDQQTVLLDTERFYFSWIGAKSVLLLLGAGGAPSFQLISPLENRDEIVQAMGEADRQIDLIRRFMVTTMRDGETDALAETFQQDRDSLHASIWGLIDALRAARLPA